MGKLLFAVVVAVASLALVESLTCNKCTFSVWGFCLGAANVTCTGTNSTCYSGRVTFPSLTSFNGFSSQNCQDSTDGCNATTPGSLLSVSYETKLSCCSTDRCNSVTVSGAPSTKMTLTAAVGAALLASVLGSVL